MSLKLNWWSAWLDKDPCPIPSRDFFSLKFRRKWGKWKRTTIRATTRVIPYLGPTQTKTVVRRPTFRWGCGRWSGGRPRSCPCPWWPQGSSLRPWCRSSRQRWPSSCTAASRNGEPWNQTNKLLNGQNGSNFLTGPRSSLPWTRKSSG